MPDFTLKQFEDIARTQPVVFSISGFPVPVDVPGFLFSIRSAVVDVQTITMYRRDCSDNSVFWVVTNILWRDGLPKALNQFQA